MDVVLALMLALALGALFSKPAHAQLHPCQSEQAVHRAHQAGHLAAHVEPGPERAHLQEEAPGAAASDCGSVCTCALQCLGSSAALVPDSGARFPAFAHSAPGLVRPQGQGISVAPEVPPPIV